MPQNQVTVVARFKAKADMIEEAKQALLALVSPTRSESGCINYDLHQDSNDPTQFLFYENWKSQSDLDEHLDKPYLEALGKKSPQLFVEPVSIELYQKIRHEGT